MPAGRNYVSPDACADRPRNERNRTPDNRTRRYAATPLPRLRAAPLHSVCLPEYVETEHAGGRFTSAGSRNFARTDYTAIRFQSSSTPKKLCVERLKTQRENSIYIMMDIPLSSR